MRAVFVVQRYGEEIVGGAESLCRQIAEHMARHWEVDAVTTCATSYQTWEDDYPPGESIVNGITVRRFRVDAPRDVRAFDLLSESVTPPHPHSKQDEVRWMRAQGPYSSTLLAFLEEHRQDYDVVFFYTYLYCTTYFGLPLVSDRALLVPTAHDEPCLRLEIFRDMFRKPRGLVFLTPEEQALVQGRFGNGHLPSVVTGIGMQAPPPAEPARFRERHGLRDRFALYLGRIDENKGCRELFSHFLRWRARTATDLSLVLIGPAAMAVPADPRVVALGIVDERDKRDALAAADLLIQPSPFESLSIVLLEAWLAGIPVLTNARCEVMKGQCRRAQGGLWYETEAEFGEALSCLLASPALRHRLAANGRRYVEANYTWARIEEKYLEIVRRALPERQPLTSPGER